MKILHIKRDWLYSSLFDMFAFNAHSAEESFYPDIRVYPTEEGQAMRFQGPFSQPRANSSLVIGGHTSRAAALASPTNSVLPLHKTQSVATLAVLDLRGETDAYLSIFNTFLPSNSLYCIVLRDCNSCHTELSTRPYGVPRVDTCFEWFVKKEGKTGPTMQFRRDRFI